MMVHMFTVFQLVVSMIQTFNVNLQNKDPEIENFFKVLVIFVRFIYVGTGVFTGYVLLDLYSFLHQRMLHCFMLLL